MVTTQYSGNSFSVTSPASDPRGCAAPRYATKGAEYDVDPGVASVVKDFHAAGKPMGFCCIAPVIPAITDDAMEAIIAKAAGLGVTSAGWIPLRLPHEVAPLFREWLETHFPERKDKVMSIVRSIRNGKDNVQMTTAISGRQQSMCGHAVCVSPDLMLPENPKIRIFCEGRRKQ